MTKPTKTQANRAKTEAGILRAAEEVFAQKGFAGSSMDAVAQQAGISKQLILYYFPGKDKLYQAVLENMIDLWLEKMQFNDDPEASPASTIRQYIQQKIELSRDYPNGSKVFAHEIINGAPVLKTYLIENLKPAFERDVKIIERWIAAGHIRPVDPKHLFFTIWAAFPIKRIISVELAFERVLPAVKLRSSDSTRVPTPTPLKSIVPPVPSSAPTTLTVPAPIFSVPLFVRLVEKSTVPTPVIVPLFVNAPV